MVMVILRYKRRYEGVYRRIRIFCNLFEGYKKLTKGDLVKDVARSKGFEYILLKLFENETRACQVIVERERIIFGKDTPTCTKYLNEFRT